MNTASIVDYIQNHYPKVIFKPVKFAQKSAIAFVVSDSQLVVGFINANGIMCKLIEPIDLNTLQTNQENGTSSTLVDQLNKIPIVTGFTQKDKDRLLRIFAPDTTSVSIASKVENDKVINSLKNQVKNLQEELSNYKVMFDSQSQQAILVETKNSEKLEEIQQEYDLLKQQHEDCKASLIKEKELAIESIKKYKDEMEEYVRSRDLKQEEIQQLYNKMVEEKTILEKRLQNVLATETLRASVLKKNEDMLSDYTEKLSTKEAEILELTKTINKINAELDTMKATLNETHMREETMKGFNTRCKDKLINEKTQIIQGIKDYNEKWQVWANNMQGNFEEYKKKMVAEVAQVTQQLDKIVKEYSSQTDAYLKLKRTVGDIEAELKRVISEQLTQLNIKDEEIRMLQKNGSGFIITDTQNTHNANSLEEKDKLIDSLQKELAHVRSLLAENSTTKVETQVDYDSCYNILQNFFALNNIFARKQEIINILDKIITNNIGAFRELTNSTKEALIVRFDKLKQDIQAHIKFLDLKKYIDSPNFEYMKSKATRSRVSKEFCSDLVNLVEYWNQNKDIFREQDVQLTNIYEDLSGAVRVYIRVKPLIGSEQKGKNVSIHEVAQRKQRSVELDCPSQKIKKVFGAFFGVFDEMFTNVDVYTGLQNTPETIATDGSVVINIDQILEETETISPGLHSIFKQVESGYNIVIFGYGLSGSGKTRTLIGGKGIPGILHYGLANLKDVEKIRVKHIFEEYVATVNPLFAKITGRIHNLVKEVPQLREKYSSNENLEFGKMIPSDINLDNIKVEDLFPLTQIIEKFRIQKGRIKATPNNKDSSRSHLYMVFEVTFKTGVKGHVTIVDTAGRESPIDIFNTFIGSGTGPSLGSIMSGSGATLIDKYLKPEYATTYTGKHVFEILKEGFYINETINHLVYYFNKKNYKQTKIVSQPTNPMYYSVDKYYVKPYDDGRLNDISNFCLTIPIMKYLDSLSKEKLGEFKPTKFIMICNVRQEELYCDQTLGTLEFAQKISST